MSEKYKSPLHGMTQTTPTWLWNDSASIAELSYAIEHGAVGAACNPVIAITVLNQEMHLWKDRIYELIREMPEATEDEIGWRVVEELPIKGAELLKPIFDRQKGKNGRLSIQTDPRFYRNTEAIVEQAVHTSQLAPKEWLCSRRTIRSSRSGATASGLCRRRGGDSADRQAGGAEDRR